MFQYFSCSKANNETVIMVRPATAFMIMRCYQNQMLLAPVSKAEIKSNLKKTGTYCNYSDKKYQKNQFEFCCADFAFAAPD